ncbi:MAG: hypothetical protein IH807_09650 [Proteobacteria bacterium]|nr:hypothetical protein [Pseudomonadota bacterium]
MSDIRRKISGSGFIKSLIRDNHGAIAVYIAIITPVMIGIGAMTLDIGRLITLHTELQYAADSASLAGARELDRFPGAIARAKAAAAGAVANIQTFAADGGGKQVAIDVTTECADTPVPPCVRFLKSLPADDDDPIQPSDVTTKDDEARFMEVHVGARAMTNALIQIVTFGSGPSTISTVASAVAGNDQVICRVPPMFMCNPTELEPYPGNLDLNLPVDLIGSRESRWKCSIRAGADSMSRAISGFSAPPARKARPAAPVSSGTRWPRRRAPASVFRWRRPRPASPSRWSAPASTPGTTSSRPKRRTRIKSRGALWTNSCRRPTSPRAAYRRIKARPPANTTKSGVTISTPADRPLTSGSPPTRSTTPPITSSSIRSRTRPWVSPGTSALTPTTARPRAPSPAINASVMEFGITTNISGSTTAVN